MPRRIPDFPDSFHSWNFLSSIGSGITFLSFAIFFPFLFSFLTPLKTFGNIKNPVPIKDVKEESIQKWIEMCFFMEVREQACDSKYYSLASSFLLRNQLWLAVRWFLKDESLLACWISWKTIRIRELVNRLSLWFLFSLS